MGLLEEVMKASDERDRLRKQGICSRGLNPGHYSGHEQAPTEAQASPHAREDSTQHGAVALLFMPGVAVYNLRTDLMVTVFVGATLQEATDKAYAWARDKSGRYGIKQVGGSHGERRSRVQAESQDIAEH